MDGNKRNVFGFVLKAGRVEQCQKVMREGIPHVQSKVRESTKAMSLAFVLLDQRVGVKRRVKCTRRSADT